MTLQTPKKNEKEQDVVSRCMEHLTKNESERFPTSEQRAAVCYSQWKREKGEDEEKKEKSHR